MGRKGRGNQSRDQRANDSEQCGTGYQQGTTGVNFATAGAMERQREEGFQKGYAVSPTEDILQYEGVSEEK
eukprot:12888213-Prorocentrum_lima.AAC.1